MSEGTFFTLLLICFCAYTPLVCHTSLLILAPVPEQEKTYIDTVGGEKVIVNRPDDSDEAEKEIEINNTQTPGK